MHIIHRTLVSVLEESAAAIVADILSVSPGEKGRFHRTNDLTAVPIQVVFGHPDIQAALSCHYVEGVPHHRGKVGVSPLVSGSGLEFRIETGDRVILLVSDEVTGLGQRVLLRIEPIESLKAIEDYGRAASTPPDPQPSTR